MLELTDNRAMPEGPGQIGHTPAMARERFCEASVLFGIDQLVKGVLRAITGLIRGVLTLLPIPGARQLVTVLYAFLNGAVGFIDEVILARGMRTRATDPWGSARTALVLYARNYRPMLKNAAWKPLFVYGRTTILFFVMPAPAALISNLYPGGTSGTGIVVAFILAWSLQQALLEPRAVACFLQACFPKVEGQSPDPQWDARLDQMARKVRELTAKALPESKNAPPRAKGWCEAPDRRCLGTPLHLAGGHVAR